MRSNRTMDAILIITDFKKSVFFKLKYDSTTPTSGSFITFSNLFFIELEFICGNMNLGVINKWKI